MHIYLARWIISPGIKPIENGGIATFGGRIVAVDTAANLMRQYHGKVTDFEDAIICPALINAHCHLELSALEYKLKPIEAGNSNFTTWIRDLIKARQEVSQTRCREAIENAVYQLLDSGVVALGDVGNTNSVPDYVNESGRLWPFHGFFFREVIAPLEREASTISDENNHAVPAELSVDPNRTGLSFRMIPAPHAPYTVAPSLLKSISNHSRSHMVPFSIHLAESAEETEFLEHGTGPIRKLMEEKGHWPPDWETPGCSPVRYMDSLGCLHERSICVHCVQVEGEDIEILARRRANVCLCPRSNIFLDTGKAPAAAMHHAGINLAIGTDSLASNRKLSIFSEMSALSRLEPKLSPKVIFQAGTEGGAKALGIHDILGTLETGKRAVFLTVIGRFRSASEALEFLVQDAENYTADINLLEGS